MAYGLVGMFSGPFRKGAAESATRVAFGINKSTGGIKGGCLSALLMGAVQRVSDAVLPSKATLSWSFSVAGAAVIAAVATYLVVGGGCRAGMVCLRDAYEAWLADKRKKQRQDELVKRIMGGGSTPKKKKARGKKERDSLMFAHLPLGEGRERMSVELCVRCVETNRLLRKLANDAGLQYDSYEPCSMCRDRIYRMACIQTGEACPSL
uniref:Uncharacterized protein n=2 Tax=Hemiselmis andersenii TaxID=464988 RepID=A0A6U4J904_HEMAN|mmetsp:Transcript_30577/g.71467  ORF Transcript_30577/g.71467 Transcript_30577/m.71467 type:complete len:208 (+) Transcript_30577:63-686(+)